MRSILAFLLTVVLAVGLNAAVETKTSTKTSTGEGTGLTREEAVNNAIVEAIGKMSGVRISSKQLSATSVKSDSGGANVSDHYAQTINKATSGRADSYEILSADQDQNGRWTATVEIKKTTVTKSYKVPGHAASNRRSITVFESSDERFRGSRMGADLQQKIITELLNSRKFNVLDRDSAGYYEAEKAIIKSGDAASDEVYKLKNVLATDYILLFAIKDVAASAKKSNLTGKTKASAEVLVDYRVLLFATRQIKFSNSLAMKIDLKDGSITATDSAISQIASRIAGDILNAIYPLKVADTAGDEVIFSQSLKDGEAFECFTQGKAIKDGYTGETTGRVETKTGAVQVTRATQKLSYAKITEGKVKKGDICRPVGGGAGTGPGYTEGKDANYELGETGTNEGIKLGW